MSQSPFSLDHLNEPADLVRARRWQSLNKLATRIATGLAQMPRSATSLCLSVEAPIAPAERLLSMPGCEQAVFWAPSADEEYAGVGVAQAVCGSGDTRFAQIRAAADRLFHGLASVTLDAPPAPPPQLIGGFAFQANRSAGELWAAFGDAQFLLPRLAYRRRGANAWLSLTAEFAEFASPSGRQRLASEALAALDALAEPIGATPSRPGVSYQIEESESAWSTLVEGIRAEIDAGRLEKVVAARRVVVRGALLPQPAQVLDRLRREAPGSTRFALLRGSRAFLGASPECLVKRKGTRLWADAVAGSVQNLGAFTRETLFKDKKERCEHDIVVRAIRSTLAPHCELLSASGPHLHPLRHVVHLRTGFSGVLKDPMHVLELAARLHPTPAVGGAPRLAALAWLDAHEHADRGFFAGPFGAFDRHGDGQFIVAIRSGLLTPGAAHLYAGAGIVAGSKSAAELLETRWKLRGLLGAVGIT
jgi:isochorismate synthase